MALGRSGSPCIPQVYVARLRCNRQRVAVKARHLPETLCTVQLSDMPRLAWGPTVVRYMVSDM